MCVCLLMNQKGLPFYSLTYLVLLVEEMNMHHQGHLQWLCCRGYPEMWHLYVSQRCRNKLRRQSPWMCLDGRTLDLMETVLMRFQHLHFNH